MKSQTIGERIEAARKSVIIGPNGKYLSRAKFAELVGRVEKTIYNWENDIRAVDSAELELIAKVTGKPVEWLRTGVMPEIRKPSRDELLKGLRQLYFEGELTDADINDELYHWRQERKQKGLE